MGGKEEENRGDRTPCKTSCI